VHPSSQGGSRSVAPQRPTSFNNFTTRLEASTAFIPAIFALDGIFLLSLPFLFPLECHVAYDQCLSLAFSIRPYNAGSLPIFLSAAIARIDKDEPARVFASGLFALQASIISLWFVVTKAPDLTVLFQHPGVPNAHSAPAFPSFFTLLLLAATFFPLIFTSGWAVRDLLSRDNVLAVCCRAAAGCCFLALLSMALNSYGQPPPPFGDDPISYFVLSGYLFAVFSPPALRKPARWTVGILSFLVVARMGFLLIVRDFSGFSYATRHRAEVLIVFLTNLCLLATTIADYQRRNVSLGQAPSSRA
jgi:hypothetical protein